MTEIAHRRSIENPSLITVHDTITVLGIGRTLFYELVKSGHLRILKIGRRTLLIQAEVNRYIESLCCTGAES